MIFYFIPLCYFIMALASKIQSKTSVNVMHGIRNVHSVRTDEHWVFAHQYTARALGLAGLVVLLVTILASARFNLEERTILVIILQILPFLLVRIISYRAMVNFDRAYKDKLLAQGKTDLVQALYGGEKAKDK